MRRKLYVKISPGSINSVSRLRNLVEGFFEKTDFDLMIEVSIAPDGRYIPCDNDVRAMFPDIKAAFVERLVVRY